MPLPNMTIFCRSLLALLVAGAATVALAQEHPHGRPPAQPAERQRPGEAHDGLLRLLPADSVTKHTVDIAGGTLTYTATAGTLPLIDQSGERTAAVYYTAYVGKHAEAANRPITFAFNGGPGAASAFLTLGLVGPRIAELALAEGAAARLTDNPATWLAFTDLVMIDPVGTGFSRAAKPDGAGAFYSVRADAEALAKVVALYLVHNGRGVSPKFILGESYGGFRAVKVARALQREQGIVVSGIVMVSPLIEAALMFDNTRFALGAALQLPSLAAAEFERQGAFSKEAQTEAERFALTEYLTTLAGAPPTGETAKVFYARVARITGLSEEIVTRLRGFIRDAYIKHLRSAERKIVSRYDANFAVADPYPDFDSARGPDPLLDGLTRAYGSVYATYAREELGFKTELTYILLANDIWRKWDWGGGGRGSASGSDDLRELFALMPSLRLLIAHGYSDMATPYSVSRYVLDHLPPIGDPARARLQLYHGGHMFYIDPESRKAFSMEAKAFYQSAQ